jgi:hypothetical protein
VSEERMPAPDFQFLQQQDFSTLRVQEMNPIERAELMRRYTVFVDHFRLDDAAPEPKCIRKWIPGEPG